jgi:hypothetical protein
LEKRRRTDAEDEFLERRGEARPRRQPPINDGRGRGGPVLLPLFPAGARFDLIAAGFCEPLPSVLLHHLARFVHLTTTAIITIIVIVATIIITNF